MCNLISEIIKHSVGSFSEPNTSLETIAPKYANFLLTSQHLRHFMAKISNNSYTLQKHSNHDKGDV